jgi:Bacterial SH3 domain
VNGLGTVLSTFGDPWMVVVLLALAMLLLETERWWTRWRRRLGRHVDALAYLIDGLAVMSAALCVVSALALLIRGVIAATLIASELLSWAGAQISAKPWLLIVPAVGVALIGVAVAFSRGWMRLPQRAAVSGDSPRPLRDWASVPGVDAQSRLGDTSGLTPANAVASAAPLDAIPATRDTPIPASVAQSYEPVEALPSLSVMAQRHRLPATPPPASFLTGTASALSSESAGDKQRARLTGWIGALVIVALVGGMIFFRQQVFDLFAEISAGARQAASSIPSPIPGTPIAASASRRVRSELLHVRARPGTDQRVITTLREGTTVVLLNETQTIEGQLWVKVRVGELDGWVSQEFLE